MHLLNQDNFDTNIVSMDVKDVKTSYYDVMRLAGKLVISRESQPFQWSLDNRLVLGVHEGGWKQNPGKIMFGNSFCWCAFISLPYRRNKDGEYLVERIVPQPGFLDLLGIAAAAG